MITSISLGMHTPDYVERDGILLYISETLTGGPPHPAKLEVSEAFGHPQARHVRLESVDLDA
jgi:hypothetical protein